MQYLQLTQSIALEGLIRAHDAARARVVMGGVGFLPSHPLLHEHTRLVVVQDETVATPVWEVLTAHFGPRGSADNVGRLGSAYT